MNIGINKNVVALYAGILKYKAKYHIVPGPCIGFPKNYIRVHRLFPEGYNVLTYHTRAAYTCLLLPEGI